MHGVAASAYLERLGQPRCVINEDGAVRDLRESTPLRRGVEAVCRYYDFVEKRFGDQPFFCPSHIETKSTAELRKKTALLGECASRSLGLMGRLPDFMNVVLMAIESHRSFFHSDGVVDFSDNVSRFRRRVRNERLFLAHAAINVPAMETADPLRHDAPRVGSKNSAGVRISGAKRMSTMAPLADEILIFNMPERGGVELSQQLVFTVPVSADGVRVYCRRTVEAANAGVFEQPLASYFDEVDGLVVLEDVFIPWADVFVFEDIRRSDGFYEKTFAVNHAAHHGLVRALEKLRFALSVLRHVVNETIPKRRGEEWSERLGAHVARYYAIEALLHASVETAETDSDGLVNPTMRYMHSARLLAPEAYKALIDDICRLCSARGLSVPPLVALDDLIKRIEGGAEARQDRLSAIQLTNVAWELAGTAFGARQIAYEFDHAGGAHRAAKACFLEFDFKNGDSMTELLEAIAASATHGGADVA